ncbi:hypothetical protein GCM10007978_42860 [Shewanella hanedai]|uniref:DUF4123 domain-containing protein n=1 Tax=Shewanella hanedai TaxID=25 RepID=A0A553JLJ7_SHEHA|nr:DUF4123 domain-containing protein [Shewanella hanedai]TRY13335.1 DUF4123 domain-containing protein [Shewanella hanedai]GGJ00607.1 hypothetical protein GCM10007978_42860 [Shewanella hanedai]
MSENSSLDGYPKRYDLFEILSTRSNKQVYLLVDAAFYEDFWDFWSSFQPKARQSWCYLFQNSAYDELRSESPLLIIIEEGEAGETLYYWLLEQPQLFSKACMLIESLLSLHQLLHFWHQRISAMYPNGECDLLTCYSSPLLALFWPSLSPKEQADFVGIDNQIYLPTCLLLNEAQRLDNSAEIETGFSLLTWAQIDEDGTADNTFSIDSPYRLSDSQYELLTRSQRRHRMVNDIFLRLSQYFAFVLDINQLSALFFSSIEIAKEAYPDEAEFSFETFAVYRFVLDNDYFETSDFKALQPKYDLRTSIQMFSQLNPPIYDKPFQSKQALWITNVEQGSDEI